MICTQKIGRPAFGSILDAMMLLVVLEAVEVVSAVTPARTTYNGCAICPLDEDVQLLWEAVGG